MFQIEIQPQRPRWPCPKSEKPCVLAHLEMVQTSRLIVVEVVEHPIAIAKTNPGPHFFRNIPSQVDFVSFPGLVEGRLREGGRNRRGRERRTQQRTGGSGAAIVGLCEIAVLRNAVGPQIELLYQAQMLGQVHRGLGVKYVGNSTSAGYPCAIKSQGVGTREQSREIFVQRGVRVGGAIGKRSQPLQSRDIIAPQTKPFRWGGGANPLVSRITEVSATGVVGEHSANDQTALSGRHRARFLVSGVDRQAQLYGSTG